MSEHEANLEVNRSLWERLTEIHTTTGATTFYDVEGFLAGRSALTSIVRSELGPVDGLDLLHLQCHFGLDTLSWAREGARVTGVDFSAAAVAYARDLASRAGLEAAFVEADAQLLPAELDGRFDVVFASNGALCWIADLGAWFAGAARALRPGGRLVVVEIHPLSLMLDSTSPLVFGSAYLGGVAQHDQWEGTYSDGDVSLSQPSVGYPHGIGEVVTAAVRAGLKVDSLTEYVRDEMQHREGVMVGDPDGWYRLPVGGQDLPLTYGLRAHKVSA
ncbi:class I SAM-dependent methyltransferase [Tenggerimyces flavus]|uniref:Class I SAM-dependent methyltransferase n=1 Tax=Tenggerimyces flavus TaxID=1708749 RepID=A0ABV7YBE9_9ACTN|nr:class I SAM-dependent methyltransferase [Tenggerimyces flavus]MBM7788940.1 SAM-dependent methyltransferase [Tenggerimyces flavus]